MTIQMVEDFNGVIEETPDGGFLAKPVTGDGFVPTGTMVVVVRKHCITSYSDSGLIMRVRAPAGVQVARRSSNRMHRLHLTRSL